jgi:hypothetical protein
MEKNQTVTIKTLDKTAFLWYFKHKFTSQQTKLSYAIREYLPKTKGATTK